MVRALLFLASVHEGKADSILEDDAQLTFETSHDIQLYPTFDSMGLKDTLLRGIYAYGTAS